MARPELPLIDADLEISSLASSRSQAAGSPLVTEAVTPKKDDRQPGCTAMPQVHSVASMSDSSSLRNSSIGVPGSLTVGRPVTTELQQKHRPGKGLVTIKSEQNRKIIVAAVAAVSAVAVAVVAAVVAVATGEEKDKATEKKTAVAAAAAIGAGVVVVAAAAVGAEQNDVFYFLLQSSWLRFVVIIGVMYGLVGFFFHLLVPSNSRQFAF